MEPELTAIPHTSFSLRKMTHGIQMIKRAAPHPNTRFMHGLPGSCATKSYLFALCPNQRRTTQAINTGLSQRSPILISREYFMTWYGGEKAKLQRLLLTNGKQKVWELVSPVLTAPEPDYKEIHPSISECGRYLDVLKAGSTDWFLIARPDNGGLHVHLGIDPGAGIKSKTMTDVPLKILQHLAYILIEYEDIISCFHDWERRGYLDTKTYKVAQSNRFGAYGHLHACGKPPKEGLKAVEHQIFKQKLLQGLRELMGSRGPNGGAIGSRPPDPGATRMKFVNWETLSDEGLTQTIEFRQHQTTLESVDVRHWVTFVVALFRAAELKADQATPPVSPVHQTEGSLAWPMGKGKIYNSRYESQEQRRDALFDLLGLDRLAQAYWIARWQEYCTDDALGEFDKLGRYPETCAACQAEVDEEGGSVGEQESDRSGDTSEARSEASEETSKDEGPRS